MKLKVLILTMLYCFSFTNAMAANWSGNMSGTKNLTDNIDVTGTVTLTGNMIINANGDDRLIKRKGNWNGALFNVGNYTLTINGGDYTITIDGGAVFQTPEDARTAIVTNPNGTSVSRLITVSDGTVNATNVVFQNQILKNENTSSNTNHCAGIFFDSGTTSRSATFTNCVFQGLLVDGEASDGYTRGAAVYFRSANVDAKFINCVFRGCLTANGGIIRTNGAFPGVLELDNCELFENQSLYESSAIYYNAYGSVRAKMIIKGSTKIHHNQGYYGAIYAQGNMDIQSAEIYNNISETNGGGICASPYDYAAHNPKVRDGFHLVVGADVSIHDNWAGSNGGGVYMEIHAPTHGHYYPTGTSNPISYYVEIAGGSVFNNHAELDGGAIYILDQAPHRFGSDGSYTYVNRHFTMSSGSLENNTCKGSGGAICILKRRQSGGTGTTTNPLPVTISGGSIMGNTSGGNGGAFFIKNETYSYTNGRVPVTVSGSCDLANNTAGVNGGVIFLYDGTIEFQSGGAFTFHNNKATTGMGGAVYICNQNLTGSAASPLVTMASGTFSSNSSGTNGGAICFEGSDSKPIYVAVTDNLTIGGSSATGNKAGVDGGGLYLSKGYLEMANGVVSYNEAHHNGGAICIANNSTLLLSGNSTSISHNHATNGGGVCANSGVNMVTFSGNLSDNSADYGGGLYLPTGATLNMANGFIGYSGHGNLALYGGGIYNLGSITLQGGATVNYNSATGHGGGIYNDGSLTISGTNASVNVTNNKLIFGHKDSRDTKNSNVYIPTDNKCIQIANGTTFSNTNSVGFTMGSGTCKGVKGGEESVITSIYENDYVFGDVPYNVCTTHPDSYYYIELSGNWANAVTEMPATGFSLSGNTATISSPEGLAWLSHYVNGIGSTAGNPSVNVMLDNDIDMTGMEWIPIGYKKMNDAGTIFEGDVVPYNGVFDGQGHTIKGITLQTNLNVDKLGLFGSLGNNATIKNLVVGDMHLSDATGISVIGGISGDAANGSSIVNTIVSACITLDNLGSIGGGMVGTNAGDVVNSYSYARLVSGVASTLGGVTGQNSGAITNCYYNEPDGSSHTLATYGHITGTNVGGGTIEHCFIPDGIDTYYSGCSETPSNSGTFTQANLFSYDIASDNRVGDDRLVCLLNDYVDRSSSKDLLLHNWVLPVTSKVNSGLPVIQYPGTIAVGSADEILLWYADGTTDLVNMLNGYTTGGISLFSNADLSAVTVNQNAATFAIHPSVSLLQGANSASIRALVSIQMQYTSSTKYYHSMASPIQSWPLGFSYGIMTEVASSNSSNPCLVSMGIDDGIFPQDINPADPMTVESSLPWDFYDFQENSSHWINYRRNSLSHWNEMDGSINLGYTNHTQMQAGKGYLAAIALPYDNDSILLQHEGMLNYGNIGVPVSKSSEAIFPGINMVGNPYESYLDFDVFASANSTLWQETPFYAAYDKDNGFVYYTQSASENYPATASRYIHKHQGFFVELDNCNASGNQLAFTESMRTNTGNPHFRDWERNYPLVNLIVTDNQGDKDICVVEMNRPDRGGASKLINITMSDGVIYARQNNQNYGVVFTGGQESIPVWFEAREDANYTLTWNTRHGEFSYLHLIDNLTGNDIDMLVSQQYVFEASISDYRSRFKLVCHCTGVEENEVQGHLPFAYECDGQLVVEGEGLFQIIDLNGRVLQQNQLSGTQNTVSLPTIAAGIYILKLDDKTQKYVLK